MLADGGADVRGLAAAWSPVGSIAGRTRAGHDILGVGEAKEWTVFLDSVGTLRLAQRLGGLEQEGTGIAMPSRRAAARLTTSSNWVGCSIGR